MVSIQWLPEMSVGIDALDSDHRLLIALINELAELAGPGNGNSNSNSETKTDIERVFDSLNRYIRLHFRREERLLAALKYSALPEHRTKHADFVAEIGRLQLAYYKNHDHHAPVRLQSYLQHWLINHILLDDKSYGRALANDPQAHRIARTLEPIA